MHHFLLSDKISQSLAGRAAILELLPFSLAELLGRDARTPEQLLGELPRSLADADQALDTVLFSGTFPRIHDQGLDPGAWLNGYVQTYVERDVRTVAEVGDLDAFTRFVGLCAGRAGQLVNSSALGSDAGVSHVTELRKMFVHHGERAPLLFWRDAHGHEVDVLIDVGNRRIPVEVKAGATVAGDFFAGLDRYLGMSGDDRGMLVYGGDDAYQRRSHIVRPWFACS